MMKLAICEMSQPPQKTNLTRQPRVRVGIATRNRAEILPKALASAQLQSYPNLEIVVLDDGSTDATPGLSSGWKQVAWLRHEVSTGLIEARNRLMRETDAEYYVSLDDDAWFLNDDEIALAVARMESDRSLAAIAFDILSPDRPNPVSRSEPAPAASFIGCGHILRLSAVKEAGYYAPTPGSYGAEEKDLCLRLADCGCRIEKMPGVHVWHDKAWNQRDWFPLHRSGVCNDLVTALRRCPLPELIAVLPYKVARHLWFAIRRPAYLKAGVSGVLFFLRNSIDVWRTRKPVCREVFFRVARLAR